MVGTVRVGSYGGDVEETMFAWKSDINTESIGCKAKIKERSTVKIPKTIGYSPLSRKVGQEIRSIL